MKYDESHGSPYDRGSADSYYQRARSPHYYPQGSYVGERITDLTLEQLEAYNAGFNDNEATQNFKDYGQE
jgi:hypothetical protein